MIETCRDCHRKGNLGNIIRYYKLHNEAGKSISVPLCFRCMMNVETIKRPR